MALVDVVSHPKHFVRGAAVFLWGFHQISGDGTKRRRPFLQIRAVTSGPTCICECVVRALRNAIGKTVKQTSTIPYLTLTTPFSKLYLALQVCSRPQAI